MSPSGVRRGTQEAERQRELIKAAGGWFLYLRGRRLRREADDKGKRGKR